MTLSRDAAVYLLARLDERRDDRLLVAAYREELTWPNARHAAAATEAIEALTRLAYPEGKVL